MVWILSYFNQYKTVIDIFDQGKSVNIETRDKGKLVTFGRISGLISKRDAKEFDRRVKLLAGPNVYKTGGNIIMKLDSMEKEFNLPRKKLLLILALCKKSKIASIYRRSPNEYKIHFRPAS